MRSEPVLDAELEVTADAERGRAGRRFGLGSGLVSGCETCNPRLKQLTRCIKSCA